MGESAARRVQDGRVHIGSVGCEPGQDCEARFQLLEKATKDLAESMYGVPGVMGLPTRFALMEADVKGMKESLSSIDKKLDSRAGQRVQIAVALITAFSAVLCAAVAAWGVAYRAKAERPAVVTIGESGNVESGGNRAPAGNR